MQTIARGGRNVLLADSNEERRRSMATRLGNDGYEVIECANGRDAFEQLLLDEALPAVIVVELELPVMSGRELLALVRTYHRFSGIPVVAMGWNDPPADAADFRPPTTFRRQPIADDDLFALVRSLSSSSLGQ